MYNIDLVLATYNKSNKYNPSMEVIERVLYMGAYEVIRRTGIIGKNALYMLNSACQQLHPTNYFFIENFYNNVLVISDLEWIAATLEEKYLLQDLKKTEEKHALFTNDPLSSDESYYA